MINPDQIQRLSLAIADADWFSTEDTYKTSIKPEWLDWLTDMNSLTARLTDFADGAFRVEVLSQVEKMGTPHECAELNLPQQELWVREVQLLCEQRPVVYARSAVSIDDYKKISDLQQLGENPLGHLLFKKGQQISQSRKLCCLNSTASDDSVYGRSTVYQYLNGSIVVQEFFINSALVQQP